MKMYVAVIIVVLSLFYASATDACTQAFIRGMSQGQQQNENRYVPPTYTPVDPLKVEKKAYSELGNWSQVYCSSGLYHVSHSCKRAGMYGTYMSLEKAEAAYLQPCRACIDINK